jgi:hypothetical protein
MLPRKSGSTAGYPDPNGLHGDYKPEQALDLA